MTRYIRVKETYCGCISVQYFSIIASCVTLVFQLTFSIFFLIYGELYGLIPMIITIGSHLFFMFIVHNFNSPICMSIYSGIEIAFSFTILGFAIWILSWIIDPEVSFLYSFCINKLHYANCYGGIQLTSLIWGCLFIIFFFGNIMMLPVFRNTWRNIKATRKSSSIYIDGDNRQNAAVQPIFNINSAPPASGPPQIPNQIVIPPQLMQQSVNPQFQGNQPIQDESQIAEQRPQNLQQQQQLNPGQTSSIMTPAGIIHLNIYTIQLPNPSNNVSSNNFYPTTTPIIDQLSTNFSDSVSQTGKLEVEKNTV